MSKPFSEQLREAIQASGMSHYAINHAAGIDKATMSKFMSGQVGLSLTAIDRLVAVLGLKLVAESSRKPKRSGTDRLQPTRPLDPNL